jgi:hypothetical protein
MALKNAHKMFKSNAERIEAIHKDIIEGKAVMDPNGIVEITSPDARGLQGVHPGLSEKARSMAEDEQGSKSVQRRKIVQKKNPKRKVSVKSPAKKRSVKKGSDATIT